MLLSGRFCWTLSWVVPLVIQDLRTDGLRMMKLARRKYCYNKKPFMWLREEEIGPLKIDKKTLLVKHLTALLLLVALLNNGAPVGRAAAGDITFPQTGFTLSD